MMNILGRFVDGKRVSDVHDICTGGGYTSNILVSVSYEDGDYGVLVFGANRGELSELEIYSGPGAVGHTSLLMKNMSRPAEFEVDTDCGYYEVNISISDERYVIAREEYQRSGIYKWMALGVGSSGETAVREMERHGVTFSAEEA